jgi:beta-lactamase regulating signal transducer with metallopeptidase domain
MIRFLFRALGMLFLAAAFVFLVYDGTRSIAANQLVYTKVEEVWSLVHAASLQRLQPWIESHGPRWLWDPVTSKLLEAPAVAALVLAGAIFIPLGRRKKRLIGFAR